MNVALENFRNNKIHPKVFALVTGCVSMTMLFAAFTSAYVVRQAAGNWLEFPLPTYFYISTGIIVLSSILLHGSYTSFKKGNEGLYKGLMVMSAMLGIGFVVCQVLGFYEMEAMGIELTGNPSGSFVYVIAAVHAAHVMAGIAVLTVAMLHAFLLPFNPTPARKLRFQQTIIYWHFVDILWVYLLFFFILQQT